MVKSGVKLSKAKGFDWNEGNIDKNWKKHKVHYKEAEQAVLNKPRQIFAGKKHRTKEERFTVYGITDEGRKLTVVITTRGDKIRVISARDQSRKERRVYGKK